MRTESNLPRSDSYWVQALQADGEAVRSFLAFLAGLEQAAVEALLREDSPLARARGQVVRELRQFILLS